MAELSLHIVNMVHSPKKQDSCACHRARLLRGASLPPYPLRTMSRRGIQGMTCTPRSTRQGL